MESRKTSLRKWHLIREMKDGQELPRVGGAGRGSFPRKQRTQMFCKKRVNPNKVNAAGGEGRALPVRLLERESLYLKESRFLSQQGMPLKDSIMIRLHLQRSLELQCRLENQLESKKGGAALPIDQAGDDSKFN